MKVLKYKGLVFDDWTEDEHGIYAQICEHCLKKYASKLDLEINSDGGVGACSVKGCDNVGADDGIDMAYLDFDINGIEITENLKHR